MPEVNETPTTESQQQIPEAAKKRPLSLLASEMFGEDFHGEAEPETPAKPEEPTEETKAPTAEKPSEPETEEAPKEPTAEEVTMSSVAELVEHFELDPDWFNTLEVADLKVDGKPVKATLKALKDSYQIQQAAEHRLEEAKAKAKSIVQDAAEKGEQAQTQLNVAAKLIEKAESLLTQKTKAPDLAKLRTEDPAEYAARKAELTEERERIEEMKREALKEYQESVKKNQTDVEKALHEHLRTEHVALLEKLPEWRDEGKAKAGKAKLAEYLMNQGFTQQDVLGASDHRLILMARKAMLYDELQANTNAAAKKVAKVPKVLKPGAPKPPEQINQERVKNARTQLRKSGTVDAAFAVLKAKRGGK